MTLILHELAAWLTDFYAAATIVLLLTGMIGICLRQPIQRMVLGWGALISLALLVVLCAIPAWPRISLRPIPVPQRAPARPILTLSKDDPRRGFLEPPRTRHLSDAPAPRSTAPPAIPKPRAVPVPVNAPTWPGMTTWLALVFLAGAGGVLVWELIGLIHVRRLMLSAQAAPEFARLELQQLVPKGSRPPRLLLSPHVTSAVACGVWQPTIVLPQFVVEAAVMPVGWALLPVPECDTTHSDGQECPSYESSTTQVDLRDDLVQLRSQLAHEWAHLQRGDLWLLGIARLLLIVLYAHPLYWWLRRTIRIDQEVLADASAAEHCGRQTYAASLVRWARQLPPQMRLAGALGMWESPGQLTRRIAMLLNEQVSVKVECGRRWRIGAGVVTAAIVAALSLVSLRPGPAVRAADPPLIKRLSATTSSPAEATPKTATEEPANEPKSSLRRGQLEIDGVCLDDQKQPLADVRLLLVFMNYDDGSQQELQEIRSDAQGRFRFAQINAGKLFAIAIQDTLKHLYQPPARKLIVIAQQPGKATTMRLIAGARPASRTLAIVMPPARSLRGRIVDEAGEPIAGVTVMVNQPTRQLFPGILHAVTDADGQYEIADLREWDQDAEEKVRRQSREVLTELQQKETLSQGYGMLRHPNYADLRFQFKVTPATQDFRLSRPASLQGQITFAETGLPAAKVQVRVMNDRSSAPAPWQTITTDAEGRYSITEKMLPGKYDIEAQLDGWPKILAHEVQLQSGKNTADLKLEAGGIIKGRVIDVSTGKPLASSPGSFNIVQTADLATKSNQEHIGLLPDGTFEIRVLPGKTMLAVLTITLGGQITQTEQRWILAGNDRQPAQIVEVAKGETKQIELRLLKASTDYGELMNSEEEQRQKLEKMPGLSPEKAATSAKPKNVSEQAAIAAIKELGGSVETEEIEGRECVVTVDMTNRKVDGETVENDQFTDDALFYLRKLPRLKSLSLARGQVTDTGLENLRSSNELEFVCLMYAWGITDVGISHLARLPKLQRFCTNDAEQLTDVSLQHFGQAANLQDLSLDGGRFSDAGLKHLASLKHLTGLYVVSSEALITDEGLAALAGHADLEELNLANTLITDAGLKHLRGLKKLKQLDLDGSAVTPAGLDELRKALPNLKPPMTGKVERAGHSEMHD